LNATTQNKLDGIRWAAVDGYTTACCYLNLTIPFEPKTLSVCLQAHVHDLILVKLAPIVTKIAYSVHLVFWVIACCDLDLWPFDNKI